MNKYYDRLTQNAALCALFGAFMGAGFIWFIASPLSENYIKFGTYGISALVALFASGIAWHSAMASIENQNRLARIATIQSLLAARAGLPRVLSGLHRKAQLGVEASLNQEELRTRPDEARKSIEQLALTPDELSALQRIIQFSDDENTARWLSLIISHFQIQQARLESNFSEAGLLLTDTAIAIQAFDWILAKTLVEHVFEYSRTGKIPASVLPKHRLQFQKDPTASGILETHWDIVHHRLCTHFGKHGGWSSLAFQNRLLNPEN